MPAMEYRSQGRQVHRCSLSIAAVALLLVVPCALAQQEKAQPPAQHAGSMQDKPRDSSFITPETAHSQNIPAAEEEDETAVYKNSPSVRKIGGMMGLSPKASSSAFEYFNFVLLAGLVLYYLAKALPKAFASRQKKIDQQLVEARAATEEAHERLQVVEARLGRLDQQIEELRKRAEEEGAADEQRIRQSIEEERKKVVAAAEQEIAVAASSAQNDLRRFAAELAMERASGQLQLTEQQDRTLVHSFAANLADADLQERRN